MTTIVDSWETVMLRDLAAWLDTSGLGTYSEAVWPTMPDVAITVADIPPKPDRSITLTLVDTIDDLTQAMAEVRLQVMVRGRPNQPFDCGNLAGAVNRLWQGLDHRDLTTARISNVSRIGHASLGKDDAGRWMRADTYRMHADLPADANRQ